MKLNLIRIWKYGLLKAYVILSPVGAFSLFWVFLSQSEFFLPRVLSLGFLPRAWLPFSLIRGFSLSWDRLGLSLLSSSRSFHHDRLGFSLSFNSWVSFRQLGFLSLIVCVSVGRLGFLLEFDVPFSSITAMDQTVVEGLLNLRLTKEEEEEISIKSRCKFDLLEECSLSLFGRLLAERN